MIDDFENKMKIIGERCGRYVGMLFVLPSHNAEPSDVLGNGAASFVDTGEKKLIITCDHVYQSYLDAKETEREVVLCIAGRGGRPINITNSHRVIDRGGNGLDLISLELNDPRRIPYIGKSYFSSNGWPPVRAQIDDIAIFAGFPGLHREASSRGLECRITPFCDTVTSVSERHFLIVDEELERQFIKFQDGLQDFGPLGGLSGAAVFVQTPGSDELSLSGFVYESNDGHDAIIFVHHADFFRVNGKIDWERIP